MEFFRAEQFWKAEAPMDESAGGSWMDASEEHPAKADAPRVFTESGM